MFDKLKNYKNIKILNNLEFKDGKFTESKPQQLPSSNAGPDFFWKKNDVDNGEDSITFFWRSYHFLNQFKAS